MEERSNSAITSAPSVVATTAMANRNQDQKPYLPSDYIQRYNEYNCKRQQQMDQIDKNVDNLCLNQVDSANKKKASIFSGNHCFFFGHIIFLA